MKQIGWQSHDVVLVFATESYAERVAEIHEIHAQLLRLLIDLNDARPEIPAVRSPTNRHLRFPRSKAQEFTGNVQVCSLNSSSFVHDNYCLYDRMKSRVRSREKHALYIV